MARSRSSRTYALSITAGLLLIISQLPGAWVAPVANPLSRLLDLAYSPLTVFLTQASSSVTVRPENPVTKVDTDRLDDALVENSRLRQQLDELRVELAELRGVRRRFGDRLTTRDPVSAAVIGWSGDRTNPLLTINRGTGDGIRPDDLVISGPNLVGRIADTGPSTSRVRLINAPDTLLEVAIGPLTFEENARRTITPIRAMGSTGRFEVRLPSNRPIQRNDAAVMHLGDLRISNEIWPEHARGLVVGSVTGITPFDRNPTMENLVTVEPVVDLSRLTRVIVITEQPVDRPALPAIPEGARP